MGSATRAALQTATAALSSQTGVTLQTAEQLLAAGRAIAGSPQLRALLADPAVSEADTATIVDRVFGSLDAPAKSLLLTAAGSRWSSPSDLVDGIEELGIRAAAASSSSTASVESELFAFQAAITSDNELELAVGSKLGDTEGKAAIVDTLLGGKSDPATLAIVRHLVQSPRGRRIGASLRNAAQIVAESDGGVVATVTAATQPTAAQLTKLSSTLAAQYGRTPRINLVLDPSIIGGLRVQVGDDVIDGSIAARLQDLRIQLAG